MSEESKLTAQEFHKKMAVSLFNRVWDLIDKAERTPAEEDEMLHAAHASRFHWGEIGTPLNFERGEWQISRVYAILNRSEPALFHAQKCLDICKAHGFGDFDTAFAHEAMARAFATSGDPVECAKHLELAERAGELIKADADKEIFFAELSTLPYQKE